MITVERYLELRFELVERGYGSEIDWAEDVGPPETAEAFACEAIWVILNSGMKEQVARGIWQRMRPKLEAGGRAKDAPFKHRLKCAAIDYIWDSRERLLAMFNTALWTDLERLEFLESLPHVGPITKFHLARNLGMDVCKPDRHLVRLAEPETAHELCSRLAEATGHRIGVVDCVLWRAANLGLV